MTPRPIDYGAGGSYRNSMRSGTIAAVLAVNANIYSFRNPSATFLAVIHRVRAQMWANLAFTNAYNDLSIKAHIARSYTTGHTTNGTAATLTGNNAKMRTSMATCASIIHILNTSNAGLTGGTATPDTDPFIISQIGKPNNPNVAVGTETLVAQPIVQLDFEPDMGDGSHPLVLAQNEGFLIQNGLVWPAAGTGVLKVEVAWSEVPVF
jgi:hypothetical protein